MAQSKFRIHNKKDLPAHVITFLQISKLDRRFKADQEEIKRLQVLGERQLLEFPNANSMGAD